jgi:hypothetical protein
MSGDFENDEILKRLGAVDPASSADEPPGERERVRAIAADRIASRRGQSSWSLRPRFVAAGAVGLLAVGVGLALVLGGSGSGPTAALAIERTQDSITLRIEDPAASDDEMNAELDAAGIDRVRVMSVPGPPDAVGTWAGFVELGETSCEGGVDRYGFGVNIPIEREKGEQHPSSRLIHVTVPDQGPLVVESVGSSFSGATLELDARSVENPNEAPKILVPVRAESPEGEPGANAVGLDRLMALGGVFARYGEAAKDGHTSCEEFGLKPLPPPTFPPPGDWVVVNIRDTAAGVRRMTAELQRGGIDGEARLVPAQGPEVGQYLGFQAVPPLPDQYHGQGDRLDVDIGDYGPGHPRPTGTKIALRASAFTAYPADHWIFYVGRAPHGGERPQVLTDDGPKDAKAQLEADCRGTGATRFSDGRKWCASPISLQVPALPSG